MAKVCDEPEKIINALWCCTHSGNCKKCGYNHRGTRDCLHRLLVDAHELLKTMYTPLEVRNALIGYGQHDSRFKLGEIIKYSPVEVEEILTKKSGVKTGD